MIQEFDVVVVGGGSGGYACALRAAQLGKKVVLIERAELGGTCLHRGCIPTKALLHVAEVAETARHGAEIGVRATLEGIDMDVVTAFRAGVVDRLHRGLTGLIEHAGITFVKGEGRLVEGRVVQVGGDRYQAKAIVLATGSYARTVPAWDGIACVVTSDEALQLDRVPNHAVVVGGSVIGVEFASLWRSLGAEVTIVEAQRSLVPLEDAAIGKQLQRAFRKRGIAAKLGVQVTSLHEEGDTVRVELENGETYESDLVLVAVGRGPASQGLGLEDAGVATDRDWVKVNDSLETSVAGVYAVGDLVAGPQLAHRGFAHGIFVAEHLAGLKPALIEDVDIPRVTYCDPEIASVGYTEEEARATFGDIETYSYNLGGNGKSQILGTTGFVKVVRRPGNEIVGIHMVGARMGEQAGEAALLVHGGAPVEELANLVHPHPTQNEALGEALLALAGKPLHAHA